MPCGCFGGGGKKKGSPRGSEAPPKPPKLVEEPIKEQQQIQKTVTPVYSSPPTEPETPTRNGQIATANGGTPQKDAETPTSEAPSSTKSTGARSRAELYAKRREFFRPLYDVCLTSSSPNQKFMTPRAASTLPARGKKGGFVIGDETGYFTSEGRFVPADGPASLGANPEEGAEVLSSDGASVEDSSLLISDHQLTDVEARIPSDRPPRPTSQPTAPAGQWDDVPDGDKQAEPQDEFHQKHQQIVQSQHSPSVPIAPPPPKQVNPHFVEFQEKHHKIVLESDGVPRDPKITEKIVEKRLTELDKLHNEVKDNYEKRSKHGPIDVESLVEKYTEDRWKNMVEMWESEGLVVEGGIVQVDDKGNVVQRDTQTSELVSVSEPSSKKIITQVTETVGPSGETVIERVEKDGDSIVKTIETKRVQVVETSEPITESVIEKIENDGDRIVKIVETKKTVSDVGAAPGGAGSLFEEIQRDADSDLLSNFLKGEGEPGVETVTERIENNGEKVIKVIEKEIKHGDDGDRISIVKTTETVTVENSESSPSLITTVITPPTPQAGTMTEEPVLFTSTSVEEVQEMPEHDFPEVKGPTPVVDFSDVADKLESAFEDERFPETGGIEVHEQIITESSSFKDSPQTCTPPPSPKLDHQSVASTKEEGSTSVCGSSNPIENGSTGAVNATPPPSPPLEASAE